ncbi:MAG: D-glycero-alpha-D-manno-heptose-1,7-bisphosphate 7-phosphatase [Bacteroidota bacterium]
MALNAAVFLDKDGTLVHDLPYNVDPARVVLRDDAGVALARLQAAGFRLIVVSNQPGVAHGYFPESALAAVWIVLQQQLAEQGVGLTAIYYCPHHPAGREARYALRCDCRKPQPGMLLRAAAEHGIDLAASWMVGDILDDVEAGSAAGCRSVLLDVGSETEWRPGAAREPDFVAGELSAAAEYIVGQRRAA